VKFFKRRPRTYLENGRESCRKCKHVFVLEEHDSGGVYFCTFRALPRPPCGSCFMHEGWWNKEGRFTDHAFERGMRLWNAWAKGREVNPWGICDEFSFCTEKT
jgi:hypothetical protein